MNRIVPAQAVATGALVFGALLTARNYIDTQLPFLLFVLGILIVATPVSTSLSRRILINGSIFLGWLPLAWWLPLPAGSDRTGFIVMSAAGLLSAWASAVVSRGGASSLLPRLTVVDLIAPTAGLLAIWVYQPFLFARGDTAALNLLMKSGWDHVAHFHMVSLIAKEGSIPETMGASPDGSNWIGDIYPKHFHALVVAVNELSRPLNSTPNPENYASGTAIVLALGIVVIAAGIAQISSLKRAPWAAWPLAAFSVSVYLFGSGSVALSAGFPNFVMGCAFAAIASLIVTGMVKATQPAYAFALAGVIVATAHSWLLLLPLAAIAGLAALWPTPARWSSSGARLTITLSMITATAFGSIAAVLVILPAISDSTISLGGRESFPAGQVALLLAFGSGMTGICFMQKTRKPISFRSRAAHLGLVPVGGTILLTIIAGIQLQQGPELQYYFGKLATGTLLVAAVSISILLANFVRPLESGAVRQALWKRAVPGVTSALLLAGSVQFSGYVGPAPGTAIPETAPGLVYRTAALAVVGNTQSAEATRLQEASAIARLRPFGTTVYLAISEGDPILQLSSQWHHALAGTWTYNSESYTVDLAKTFGSETTLNGSVGDKIKKLLATHPELTVIASPSIYSAIEPGLDSTLSLRLLTW